MSGDTLPQGFDAYDQLATMVAIARRDGHCLFANSTLENTLAVSRRALLRGSVLDWFVDPLPMRETLLALHRDEVTSGRFEAQLKRAPWGLADPLLVRVNVGQMEAADWALVEMVEIDSRRGRTAKSVRSAWPRPTRNWCATWRTRSRTRWAAYAVRRSCWRWS